MTAEITDRPRQAAQRARQPFSPKRSAASAKRARKVSLPAASTRRRWAFASSSRATSPVAAAASRKVARWMPPFGSAP